MEKKGTKRRNEDIPIEAALNIIKTSTRHELASYRIDLILKPCLKFIKKESGNNTYLATKAIGLLAIKIAQCERGKELLEKIVSTFSDIESEDVTIQMLNCLAITTFAGATQFCDIETSMKIIWQFICSYSDCKVNPRKKWASVMSSAILIWSLLLTRIHTTELKVLTNWETGVMARLIDMLQNEECISGTCVGALAIISEKKCFEPFSGEDYDGWTIENWKDEIREQITPICGWKPDVSTYFEASATKYGMPILYRKIRLNSWGQFMKISFIQEFLGNDFTLQMMEDRFIRYLFELEPNVGSFGPNVYEPFYDKVEDNYKGCLKYIKVFTGTERKMITSKVQKKRSMLQSRLRAAKADMGLSNFQDD